MNKVKQVKHVPKSARGDWWGGFFFLLIGLFFLQLAARGRAWILYPQYGACEPLAPWQVVGIGAILTAMGLLQLVIAVRKTRRIKQKKIPQHQQIQPIDGKPGSG